MAPRKPTKAEGAEEASDMIYNYLRKQNRPYSANEISANLHNKVTKAAATKHLKDLHERKAIEGRASGKQLVYHAVQSDPQDAEGPTLTELDEQAKSLQAETTQLQTTLKNLKTQLSTLTSNSLSTTDLNAAIDDLSSERQQLQARLGPLRTREQSEGLSKAMSKQEEEYLQRGEKYWQLKAERRAKIKKEMWGMLSEVLGQMEGVNEADVREGLGVDD